MTEVGADTIADCLKGPALLLQLLDSVQTMIVGCFWGKLWGFLSCS